MSRRAELDAHKRVMAIASAEQASLDALAERDNAPWEEFEQMEVDGRVPLRIGDRPTREVLYERHNAVRRTNLDMPPLRVLMPELFEPKKRTRAVRKPALSVVR